MCAVADPRMRPRAVAVIAAAILASGCDESASRVRLVPLGGDCARPLGAVAVRVTAYTATGERSKSIALDEVLAIDDFPADTEQLAVEVIAGGGVTAAAGKSAPLAYGELADGATIPVFMAPPDGACPTTSMRAARRQPLIARAGRGVLVVGGVGADGPLATAELYDPDTEAWTEIDVPAVLASDPRGFAGAVLTTLPDGRVALTGGPLHAFAMFDPAKQAFDRNAALFESRVYHAAIATAEGDVIVAGGCSTLGDDGACAGVALHQTVRYHQGELGDPDRSGPPTNGRRVSATLFDTGVGLDGARRYVLAGGTGDPGFADRFALTDATVVKLDGGGVAAAALDGGAVLAAFESAVVYPPDGAAVAVAAPPATTGARLIALEDGSVAGFGGDPDGSVLRYGPTANQWTRELGNTGALTDPALVRLDDGSVLVLGGDGSARAWRYRPSLVGPAAGSVTAATMTGVGRGVLTAPDPRAVTRQPSGQWQLSAATDALTARALVGGPRTATGSVRMTGNVVAGGAALIAAQRGPGQAVIAELAPGAPARLIQLDGARRTELCAGSEMLAAFDPAAPIALRLAIADGMARATIDDREVLACPVTITARGAWGVAALGAGAVLAVDSVTVAR